MSDSTVTTCYRHPDRPTRLSCSTCEKPICVECSRDASVGQKCPECAAPAPGARVVQARSTLGRPNRRTSPVSFAIIGITVAIYVIGSLSPAADAWLSESFTQVNAYISDGEWYRLFSSALLHANLMHLFFNMYALYIFGPRLEQQVGSAAFASLYIATAGTGGLASYVFGPETVVIDGQIYLTSGVGASGAIFGLFGAWLFVAWRMRSTPGGRAMFNQLFVLLAINMALPLIVPNIGWRAHIGGFVGGILIAWLWSRFAVGRPNARMIRTAIAVAVIVGSIAAAIVL